jgi:predicted ATP-binding protein involved in virulence
MKINEIELKDYKLFKGKRAFKFDDRLNLISGPNGSGKTILFNALRESIASEVPGVKIIIEGELDDFKNNLDLIFIDEEQIRKNEPSTADNQSTGSRNFEALIKILEKRASTKKNMPLAMDAHIFSIMNQADRERLFEAILSLQTQIILFEHDFKGMKGGKRYHLKAQR